MDAQTFWAVIARYNEETVPAQIFLLLFSLLAILLSYTDKVRWAAKFALGITNLYIGFIFFARYGTEPIQRYFALPLYLLCGTLFLYESWHSRNDPLQKPGRLVALLLSLYVLYPLVSVVLGARFPQMVTYIMPCPVVSLSIAVYAGYATRNKLLLALLSIWGLTGIKSVLFHAYEDVILLICGIYGIVILANEIRASKREKTS